MKDKGWHWNMSSYHIWQKGTETSMRDDYKTLVEPLMWMFYLVFPTKLEHYTNTIMTTSERWVRTLSKNSVLFKLLRSWINKLMMAGRKNTEIQFIVQLLLFLQTTVFGKTEDGVQSCSSLLSPAAAITNCTFTFGFIFGDKVSLCCSWLAQTHQDLLGSASKCWD